MSLNVELIKQIRRDVLAFPEHFDMSHWIKPAFDREFIPSHQIVEGDFMEIDGLVGSCGTTACIAGWAIMHGRDQIPAILPTLPGSPSELGHDRLMHHLGAALLGITSEEAENLFYRVRWPQNFDTAAYRYTFEYSVPDQPRGISNGIVHKQDAGEMAHIAVLLLDELIENPELLQYGEEDNAA